jgi:hypothetical protein
MSVPAFIASRQLSAFTLSLIDWLSISDCLKPIVFSPVVWVAGSAATACIYYFVVTDYFCSAKF